MIDHGTESGEDGRVRLRAGLLLGASWVLVSSLWVVEVLFRVRAQTEQVVNVRTVLLVVLAVFSTAGWGLVTSHLSAAVTRTSALSVLAVAALGAALVVQAVYSAPSDPDPDGVLQVVGGLFGATTLALIAALFAGGAVGRRVGRHSQQVQGRPPARGADLRRQGPPSATSQ
jgi:hypothetical protein